MAAPRVPLKEQLLNHDKVSLIAAELKGVHAAFRKDEFVHHVLDKFPELELKARIAWIATCLEAHLPGDYRRAVGIILRSLPAPNDPSLSDGDFGDFIYALYAELVARQGCTQGDLEFSLSALRELTMRFSAEDAIRPFINAFPDDVLAALSSWTGDEHYHVRRLCSEGTRPKLPWSKALETPPEAAIPILDKLYCDSTRFVTRSVANHINDISKLDAELAVDTLERWTKAGRQHQHEMDYLVRHATRSLTKAGHPRALALIGIPPHAPVAVSRLAVAKRVELDTALEFSFDIHASEDAEVIADYAIYYPGSSGKLTRRKISSSDGSPSPRASRTRSASATRSVAT